MDALRSVVIFRLQRWEWGLLALNSPQVWGEHRIDLFAGSGNRETLGATVGFFPPGKAVEVMLDLNQVPNRNFGVPLAGRCDIEFEEQNLYFSWQMHSYK